VTEALDRIAQDKDNPMAARLLWLNRASRLLSQSTLPAVPISSIPTRFVPRRTAHG